MLASTAAVEALIFTRTMLIVKSCSTYIHSQRVSVSNPTIVLASDVDASTERTCLSDRYRRSALKLYLIAHLRLLSSFLCCGSQLGTQQPVEQLHLLLAAFAARSGRLLRHLSLQVRALNHAHCLHDSQNVRAAADQPDF